MRSEAPRHCRAHTQAELEGAEGNLRLAGGAVAEVEGRRGPRRTPAGPPVDAGYRSSPPSSPWSTVGRSGGVE